MYLALLRKQFIEPRLGVPDELQPILIRGGGLPAGAQGGGAQGGGAQEGGARVRVLREYLARLHLCQHFIFVSIQ